MPRLSILGLLNWDENLFENFKLPVSPYSIDPELYIESPDMDIEVLTNFIIMECAELSVYVTRPDLMKQLISSWSTACLPSWQRIYNSYFFKYNPIWNKDGTITRTETETETETRDLESNITNNRSLNSNSSTSNTVDNDIDDTKQVSAYNSTTFQNAEKNTRNESGSAGGTFENEETENTTRKDADTGTINKNVTRKYEDKEQGNIGVTLTQSMISAERDIYVSNMYEYITNQFKEKFCILVY